MPKKPNYTQTLEREFLLSSVLTDTTDTVGCFLQRLFKELELVDGGQSVGLLLGRRGDPEGFPDCVEPFSDQ